MDVLDEDIIEFWRKLNNNQVDFIMIGGFAAILHGVSRITQGVDIWIKDTVENRQRLRKTIADSGLGDYEQLESMEFVPGCTTIYLTQGIELDIYTSMKALPQTSFDECFKHAFIADIEGAKV